MTPSHPHTSPAERIEHDPDYLDEAREHIENLDIPGTPSLYHARHIKAAGLPFWAGIRKVTAVDIGRGRPNHGEMRTDDHVSRFEIELPRGHVDGDAIDDDCSCRGNRVTFSYSAYHNIAGSAHIWCLECKKTLHTENWG